MILIHTYPVILEVGLKCIKKKNFKPHESPIWAFLSDVLSHFLRIFAWSRLRV